MDSMPTVPCAQVVASGVCHTDWAYLHGAGKGMELRPFPLVLGHEGAGVVESVGAGVTRFSPGESQVAKETPEGARNMTLPRISFPWLHALIRFC